MNDYILFPMAAPVAWVLLFMLMLIPLSPLIFLIVVCIKEFFDVYSCDTCSKFLITGPGLIYQNNVAESRWAIYVEILSYKNDINLCGKCKRKLYEFSNTNPRYNKLSHSVLGEDRYNLFRKSLDLPASRPEKKRVVVNKRSNLQQVIARKK